MNAFWRFCNHRGLPRHEKELSHLLGKLDENQIVKESSTKVIEWHFNPPRTPHTGGVWEVMVRAAKRAMKKLLGNADVTDDELLTIATGAEQLINSRPLTYQSSSANDIVPLTPNHFLIGQLGGEFAPDCEHHSNHPLKWWKRVQEILQHFWTRWVREIIPGLNPRSKWRTLQRNIRVGNIVLVLTLETEQGKWPLKK